MTLLSSIRASRILAPRTATAECWPEGILLTPDDLLLNGVSLAHTVRETPAVRIGPAGTVWPGPARSPQRFITVLLTRVQETGYIDSHRLPVVWVDADLERCRPILSAVRVIGRRSVARAERMQLRPLPTGELHWVQLPSDVVVGDLLAIPCTGTVPLSQVRQRTPPPPQPADVQPDDPDGIPFLRACGK